LILLGGSYNTGVNQQAVGEQAPLGVVVSPLKRQNALSIVSHHDGPSLCVAPTFIGTTRVDAQHFERRQGRRTHAATDTLHQGLVTLPFRFI
jgi:hypothetical protein